MVLRRVVAVSIWTMRRRMSMSMSMLLPTSMLAAGS